MTEHREKAGERAGGKAADSTGLDAFFDAARAAPPQPAQDWLARVTEAALDEQARVARPVPQPGFFAQLRGALGGWPGIAGLAAACAAGVWIGVSPPAAVSGLWDSAGVGSFDLDPLSGYDLALVEG